MMRLGGRGRRQVARCGFAVLCAVLTAASLWAQGAGLRLRSLQGGEVLSEADLAQGTTIVVVWASWSPRCRDLPQRMPALASAIGGRGKLITVNFEEQADTVRSFLTGADLGAPVYLDTDGAFARRYAISTLPGLLVLKNGEVAYRGRLPESPAGVLADILN